MKPWFVPAAIALVVCAWMLRWTDPVAAGRESAYIVDRFTGQAWLLSGEVRYKVEHAPPAVPGAVNWWQGDQPASK